MSESIFNYYLLCTVRLGGKRHIMNDLDPGQLAITLTKKELSLYLRKQDGQYIINDTVVGGNEADGNEADGDEAENSPVIIL